MEAEIIQTVLTEVMEDLQELKQQNAGLVGTVLISAYVLSG
ncbi:hypothetical protein [Segetibacter aerophilus]|nr:hypothetical protein [Segetibacter aerophilus]